MKAIATGMLLAALVMAIVSAVSTPTAEAKSKSKQTVGYVVVAADHTNGEACRTFFKEQKNAKSFQKSYYPEGKVQKADQKQLDSIEAGKVADCTVSNSTAGQNDVSDLVFEDGYYAGAADMAMCYPMDVVNAPQAKVDTLRNAGYKGDPNDGKEALYAPGCPNAIS